MKYRNTLAFTALTPFLILLCIFMAGGGHGYYTPAIFLFPTALAGFLFSDELLAPFMILGIIQFPLYGILLDNLKSRRITMAILIVCHLLLASIVFWCTRATL